MGRPCTRSIVYHRLQAVDLLADQAHQLTDGDGPSATRIIWSAELDLWDNADRQKCRNRVLDEGEVTARSAIANTDACRGRVEHLAHDGRDNCTFALPWTKRIEGPKDGHRKIEGANVAFGQHICRDFGGG